MNREGTSFVLTNSFVFAKAHISTNEILRFGYYWLIHLSVTSSNTMTGHSHSTTCEYYHHFDDLIEYMISDHLYQIGGREIIEEIYESKFRSRKYYRGHRVEGVWIVGAVEKTTERNFASQNVKDRSTETMENLNHSYIKPVSKIVSDFWKSYEPAAILNLNYLYKSNYTYDKINHSLEYVSDTGACTNTIEGTWNGVKCNSNNREMQEGEIDRRICVFIWFRQNENYLWDALMDALREIEYD